MYFIQKLRTPVHVKENKASLIIRKINSNVYGIIQKYTDSNLYLRLFIYICILKCKLRIFSMYIVSAKKPQRLKRSLNILKLIET